MGRLMGWGLRARLAGLLCGVVLALAPDPSWGQQTLRGVALVIGQSNYGSVSDLPNAQRDADAIENLLGDLGFEASVVSDRDGQLLRGDLDAFRSDAEGADVAIVYYAGHAVEIEGEYYLVPTDADPSSPELLAAGLISLAEFVSHLRAEVIIILLDACRDNPFPPGTMIRRSGDAAPVAVSSSRLQSRSAIATARTAPATDPSFGIVVGFAAEPGKIALDGEPGGNSPYAAALLRHIGAMEGQEFGTVMRMVAEEVYLKTSGKQRPWVNESLRRLLYFGQARAAIPKDEADVLTERRKLLLTIAELPERRRKQVEVAAAEGGVPMDVLYGILRALGTKIPQDPAKLDDLLRSEAERVAKILIERQAVSTPDPEIARLSKLADAAEREGLLAIADDMRERAKARVRGLRQTRRTQEEALRQRNIEDASVFARSAETKLASWKLLAAADDFAEAFRIVERWDGSLAWYYKHSEISALTDHGRYNADNAALSRAIEEARRTLRLSESLDDKSKRAEALESLGVALIDLGEREVGREGLDEAVVVFRETLQLLSRESNPLEWASSQIHLGNALQTLGWREDGKRRLEEAATAYRAALQVYKQEEQPLEWNDS